MNNRELNRYVGDYDKFMEVYEMKKSQQEAAYQKQQKEIADLKDYERFCTSTFTLMLFRW